MSVTLRDTLELTADKYPERDAIVYPRRDQRWTYAEFDEKANQLANALAERGVEPDDRVSTMLYNGSRSRSRCSPVRNSAPCSTR
jgi:long-chain acyl-CoA synthetase